MGLIFLFLNECDLHKTSLRLHKTSLTLIRLSVKPYADKMTETELISVKTHWENQEYPDLSWLETELKDGKIIDSMRYTQEEYDKNPEQVQAWIDEDQGRFRSYGYLWWMLGCYATAQVKITVNPNYETTDTIRSGGLWGIESDSDTEYKKEVETEQLEDLKIELEKRGIDTTKFNHLTTEP